MRRARRWGAACLIVASLGAGARGATLHTDDFQSGLAGWTSGGAVVTREDDGGADGEGDGFVRVEPTFRNLAVHNSLPAWTGDFAVIGATAVTADLMAPVGSAPLSVRLVLFGPGQAPNNFVPRWTSSVAADVPADGVWRPHTFSLAEEDLALVLNSGTHEGLMGGVLRVMLRHDPGDPDSMGTPVDGTLAVDNVTLAGPATLGGDYNEDGVVDAADYAEWRDHLGALAGALPNDVDGGEIGAAQYTTWRTAYGTTSESQPNDAPSSTPEPGAAWLLTLCGAGLFSVKRNAAQIRTWRLCGDSRGSREALLVGEHPNSRRSNFPPGAHHAPRVVGLRIRTVCRIVTNARTLRLRSPCTQIPPRCNGASSWRRNHDACSLTEAQ